MVARSKEQTSLAFEKRAAYTMTVNQWIKQSTNLVLNVNVEKCTIVSVVHQERLLASKWPSETQTLNP